LEVSVLLVDDLLAAPLNGILWVFKEIHKAATEEQRNRRDQIMAALSALYLSLEQGEITDADFDAQEMELLDELDELDGVEAEADDADDDSEEAPYALKAIPAGHGDAPAAQGEPVSETKEKLS
jgi:hypothetical protein